MTIVEMPREPEQRYILDAAWTRDELLAFLEDLVDLKIKYGKCPADEREQDIAYLMYVLWHRHKSNLA
jgi:hypothetical protein